MEPESSIRPSGGFDWRLRISFLLTLAWLFLGVLYISSVVGWTDFARQNAPSLGGFLEGAFESSLMPDAELQPALSTGVHHPSRRRRIESERLLAEHMPT